MVTKYLVIGKNSSLKNMSPVKRHVGFATNEPEREGNMKMQKRQDRVKFLIRKGTDMYRIIADEAKGRPVFKMAKWKLLRKRAMNEIAVLKEAGQKPSEDLLIQRDFPFEIGGGVMALYAQLPLYVINFGRSKLGLKPKKKVNSPSIAFILNGGKLTLIGGAADFIIERSENGYLLDTEAIDEASTREVREEWGGLGDVIADKLEKIIPKLPGHYMLGLDNYLATGNPNHVTAGSYIRAYDLVNIMPIEDLSSSIMSGKAGSEEGKIIFADFDTLCEIGPNRVFGIHWDYLREYLQPMIADC